MANAFCLCPHIATGAILQRLGDMRRGDRLAACQVGNRARQLEDPMEGAGSLAECNTYTQQVYTQGRETVETAVIEIRRLP